MFDFGDGHCWKSGLFRRRATVKRPRPDSEPQSDPSQTRKRRKKSNTTTFDTLPPSDRANDHGAVVGRDQADRPLSFHDQWRAFIQKAHVTLLPLLNVEKRTFGDTSRDDDGGVIEPADWMRLKTDPAHEWLFNRIHSNATDRCTKVFIQGRRHNIPPRSTYIVSDFDRVQPLFGKLAPFDLIVMDPPWFNKSVKRKRNYTGLDAYELFKIPVDTLASAGCYVCVWVSNNPKLITFVTNKLLPAWGCRLVGIWKWIKVDVGGALVSDMDDPHHKPYEPFVIAQKFRGEEGVGTLSLIPEERAVVSIPSAVHSQKPVLDSILSKYLKPDARKLELFARNALPGWTSWGNETLKYNDEMFMEIKT
ncbi:Methyltransferase-like protein 4 [Irineochytrium annulatum]|nr:Methyltransferase-like protein 4 [Irineochytrium annulatum]